MWRRNRIWKNTRLSQFAGKGTLCNAMWCDATISHHISALGPAGGCYTSFRCGTIVTLPREVEDSQGLFPFRHWMDKTPTQAHPADGGIMGDALGRTGSTPLSSCRTRQGTRVTEITRPMKSGRGAQSPSAEQRPELAISPNQYSREQRIRQK